MKLIKALSKWWNNLGEEYLERGATDKRARFIYDWFWTDKYWKFQRNYIIIFGLAILAITTLDFIFPRKVCVCTEPFDPNFPSLTSKTLVLTARWSFESCEFNCGLNNMNLTQEVIGEKAIKDLQDRYNSYRGLLTVEGDYLDNFSQEDIDGLHN